MVYVVKDDGAEMRKIDLGYSAGERAVVHGVQPGERVVVEGKQNLRPGSRVRVEGPAGRQGATAAASVAQRNPS